MKYRVILKVSYHDAWFDFDTIDEAADFAKSILAHMVDSDDTKAKRIVRLDIIDTTKPEDEEED